MNHEERLIEFLDKHKFVTQKVANDELGNSRLSATIFNLRKNYIIEDTWIKVPNKWGKWVNAKAYFFEDDRIDALKRISRNYKNDSN